MVAGHSPQRTVYTTRLPVNYDTQLHTTLAGIEPTTFRLLVRRATSRATETKKEKKKINSNSDYNEENNTDVG